MVKTGKFQARYKEVGKSLEPQRLDIREKSFMTSIIVAVGKEKRVICIIFQPTYVNSNIASWLNKGPKAVIWNVNNDLFVIDSRRRIRGGRNVIKTT